MTTIFIPWHIQHTLTLAGRLGIIYTMAWHMYQYSDLSIFGSHLLQLWSYLLCNCTHHTL